MRRKVDLDETLFYLYVIQDKKAEIVCYLYLFVCFFVKKFISTKRNMEPLTPFKYVIISPEETSMKEGCIISEFNQCGLFLCQKGQAEILLGGRPYQINKRNLFIYTAANLLQIRQRSADLEGIMIEVTWIMSYQ